MDNPNIYVQRGTGAAYYQGYPVTQHANGRHYYTDSTTKQSRWVTRVSGLGHATDLALTKFCSCIAKRRALSLSKTMNAIETVLVPIIQSTTTTSMVRSPSGFPQTMSRSSW